MPVAIERPGLVIYPEPVPLQAEVVNPRRPEELSASPATAFRLPTAARFAAMHPIDAAYGIHGKTRGATQLAPRSCGKRRDPDYP